MERLPERLQQAGVPAADCFFGGRHRRIQTLCSSLYFAEREGRPQRSGFVHIPVLPEQVIGRHRSSPVMPLETTRRALFPVIAEMAAAWAPLQFR